MEDTRFAYSVNPRRPISGIANLTRAIRTPTTLKLTKEEVKKALKCGPVYRRFSNEGINIRVTGLDLDRLHNEKYMTEDEYKAFLSNNTEGAPEEPKTEVPTANVELTPVKNEQEEQIDNEPETDEVENNTDSNEDVIEEEIVEKTVNILDGDIDDLYREESNSEPEVELEYAEENTANGIATSDDEDDASSDLDSDTEDSDEDIQDDVDEENNDDQIDSDEGQTDRTLASNPVVVNYGGKKKNKKHRNN